MNSISLAMSTQQPPPPDPELQPVASGLVTLQQLLAFPIQLPPVARVDPFCRTHCSPTVNDKYEYIDPPSLEPLPSVVIKRFRDIVVSTTGHFRFPSVLKLPFQGFLESQVILALWEAVIRTHVVLTLRDDSLL